VITQAILKLLPLPAAKHTLTATFGTLVAAAQVVSEVIRQGIMPSALEFLDGPSLRAVGSLRRLRLPRKARAFLLAEVDGAPDYLEGPLNQVRKICQLHGALEVHIARGEADQDELWRARREVSPALRKISPIRMNEDIVVPRSKIPEIIERIDEIAVRHGVPIVNFGHAGDGNIHVNVMAGDGGEADRPKMKRAVEEIFAETVALGGRISGEHGIGLSKQPYIGLNLDQATLTLSRRLKKFFDPHNILNPGKMFPPEPA
jgi:glycolate oxidase